MKFKYVVAFVAFVAVTGVMLGLQWVSGIPFERSIGEAEWVFYTLTFATLAAWAVWMLTE